MDPLGTATFSGRKLSHTTKLQQQHEQQPQYSNKDVSDGNSRVSSRSGTSTGPGRRIGTGWGEPVDGQRCDGREPRGTGRVTSCHHIGRFRFRRRRRFRRRLAVVVRRVDSIGRIALRVATSRSQDDDMCRGRHQPIACNERFGAGRLGWQDERRDWSSWREQQQQQGQRDHANRRQHVPQWSVPSWRG